MKDIRLACWSTASYSENLVHDLTLLATQTCDALKFKFVSKLIENFSSTEVKNVQINVTIMLSKFKRLPQLTK